MTGHELKSYRKKSKVTQLDAARELGVSQTYLSLLENGKRPLSNNLQKKVVRLFQLPPTKIPVRFDLPQVPDTSDDQLTSDLSALGYVGFAHFEPSRGRNPAAVLLSALKSPKRDARLVEALPWVVLTYPNLGWNRLVKTAKMYDLQNRLGYVTGVARQLAERNGDSRTAEKLRDQEAELERSLLVREETLCNETMTRAERSWLAQNRPEEAKRWHLLTDLSPQHLRYV